MLFLIVLGAVLYLLLGPITLGVLNAWDEGDQKDWLEAGAGCRLLFRLFWPMMALAQVLILGGKSIKKLGTAETALLQLEMRITNRVAGRKILPMAKVHKREAAKLTSSSND